MLRRIRHRVIHLLLPAGAYCDLCKQVLPAPYDASGPEIVITTLRVGVDGGVEIVPPPDTKAV